MNIVNEYLILRAIEPEDAPMLLKMINDPEMEFLLGGYSFPVSKKDQEKWIEDIESETHTLRCIIEIKTESKAVGVVMLTNIDLKNGNAEIHIKLEDENSRGKGIGIEAINLLTDYAFQELRLHCVYAFVNENNNISQKLFTRCGFEKEGRLKERVYKRGKYMDILSFSKIEKV